MKKVKNQTGRKEHLEVRKQFELRPGVSIISDFNQVPLQGQRPAVGGHNFLCGRVMAISCVTRTDDGDQLVVVREV